MRYLLDTHILFWSMSEENRIPESVLSIINSRENDIFFSSASVWEVVIKHAKNPINMPVGGQEFIEGCLLAGYCSLPIDNQHVLAVSELKRGDSEPPHNDPFDRILIAQAKTENMILITHDSLLDGYYEKCIMKI